MNPSDSSSQTFGEFILRKTYYALRFPWIGVVALTLPLLGCLQPAPPPTTDPTPRVRVLKVEPVEGKPTLEVTGSVVTQETARVHPEISGTLLKICVREGDKVRRDDILAEVDPQVFRLHLEVASAERLKAQAEYDRIERGYRPEDIEAQRGKFRNARAWYELEIANLDRNRKLNESGIMTQREWSDFLQKLTAQKALLESASSELLKMEAGYETYDIQAASASLQLAVARERLAARDLEETRILSPMDGIVTQRLVEVGQLVSPDKELFEIQDPERIWLLAEVAEKYADVIEPDQSATLRIDSAPGGLPGRVDRIGGALDSKNHSMQVWIAWEDGSPLPPIGVFARAVIDLPVLPTIFQLRRDWVHMADGEHHVWVIEEGALARRSVILGEDKGDVVSILEGVEAGTEVVVSPPHDFHEGLDVKTEPYLLPEMAGDSATRVLSLSNARSN